MEWNTDSGIHNVFAPEHRCTLFQYRWGRANHFSGLFLSAQDLGQAGWCRGGEEIIVQRGLSLHNETNA